MSYFITQSGRVLTTQGDFATPADGVAPQFFPTPSDAFHQALQFIGARASVDYLTSGTPVAQSLRALVGEASY